MAPGGVLAGALAGLQIVLISAPSRMSGQWWQREPCTTFKELWGELQAARVEITPANLQNYLFERKLADCIEKGAAVPRSGSEYFCSTCNPLQLAVPLLQYTDTHSSNDFNIIE